MRNSRISVDVLQVMRLWLLVALVVLAAACGQPAAQGPSGVEEARSAVAFEVSSASETDLAAVVAGDTAFALELAPLLYVGENLIFSPFSITTALGMLEPGARGETHTEMVAMLHETLPEDRLHAARGALLAAVNAPPSSVPEGDALPFTLRAVNASWSQRGYPIVEDYLDVLARSFDAGTFLLDFGADPNGSRLTINDWVANETEQRIEDLIPEGVITDLTRLVLTNAIYFKANWLNQFSPDVTEDGSFHSVAGDVTVPFMHGSVRAPFVEQDGFRAVWLPYVGDASMMVLLPDGDVGDLLGSLDPDSLGRAREARGDFQVELAMPKFEFGSPSLLSDTLKELGMVTAFITPSGSGGADLTGITDERELYVQEVVHEGFIKVDEVGTEAAAATAIVVGVTSLPQPTELILDRPFLFLIQHEPTGAILFAGVVANPAG